MLVPLRLALVSTPSTLDSLHCVRGCAWLGVRGWVCVGGYAWVGVRGQMSVGSHERECAGGGGGLVRDVRRPVAADRPHQHQLTVHFLSSYVLSPALWNGS